jgi:uncharacterized protein
MKTDEQMIADTKNWLERAVIGLNLCPFAKAVHVKGQIRYMVSNAQNEEELLADLLDELQLLYDADIESVETTIVIHPYVLEDFLDYNDFLEIADAAVSELDLNGEIQVASFHPDYQFAETTYEDIENFSNRSPYPCLHLLRESSVEKAVSAFPDAGKIYEKNIETLRALGIEGWKKLWV